MSILTARFQDALIFAYQTHATQHRKVRPTPFIAHLMAVTSTVLEHGASEDVAIAALLHDAVEDQGGAPMLAQIRTRFGDHVAAIVLACSDADTTPKPPWLARKTAFIERLRTAPADVRLVVAADKLHNVRSILSDYQIIGPALWTHFTGGKQGTLWYYRTILDILQATDHTPLVSELATAVATLEQLAQQDPAPLP